ncbi:aquaporin [Peniophora sp. CONT]|nr:aquaporin [Peniophora sp. CONT]
MNELNSASLATHFERPTFTALASIFAPMSSGKTTIVDKSDGGSVGRSQDGHEGGMMDTRSEGGEDSTMASMAGGTMNGRMGSSSMATTAAPSTMMTTAPSAMTTQNAGMQSAGMTSTMQNTGGMMDMMAPIGKSEPGPGQPAIADEALALEYNRLVDYHARYPNVWSSIREPFRECAAEALGTFILCLAGIGTNLQVGLSARSDIAPAPRGDWNSISWGWSLGVAIAVWVAGGVSGGHVNPAVTISFAVFRRFPWRKVPFYIAAQVFGAFLAGLVCYFNYSHALTIYEGSPTIRTVPGTAAFLTCYALDYVSNTNAFFDAFIGPFILMVVLFAVTDRTNGGGVRRELVPLVAFATLFVISSGFGYQTLWALNPARDFGPRLATYLVGYGTAVWTYRGQYWLWCNICSPILGAVCGSLVYELFINVGPDSIINTPSRAARQYLRATVPGADEKMKAAEMV